jgi:hypothetical protein
MALFPVSPELIALKEAMVDVGHDPDALRTAVREHFGSHGGIWELRAQLCTDLKAMPIEDASVQWLENQSPYRTVARITAKPQDTWTADKVRRVDDGMSFLAWLGGASATRVRHASAQGHLSHVGTVPRSAKLLPNA